MLDEDHSVALFDYLSDRRPIGSCALARTEVLRAAGVRGSEVVDRARRTLQGLRFVALDDALLAAAGAVMPWSVRSLDAIHLAAAISLGSDLSALVTYDHRMADAARALGMTVESPGASG